MMGWRQQQPPVSAAGVGVDHLQTQLGHGGGIHNNAVAEALIGSGLGVQVMTDEQMEMLRKQISVYATICERLVAMHTSFSLNRPEFSGMLPYGDPLSSCGSSRIPSRQRWAPKQAQLQILERIFAQCNANPGKEKIKEITAELSKYGQVKEASVYNWFQNRRARCKRKHSSAPGAPKAVNFDVEAELDAAAKEKENKQPAEDENENENEQLIVDQLYFHSPEIGIDQLIGKLEVCDGYNLYWQEQQNGFS
ncbi:unnamed protein product [Linum tenue]|uniref:Homeobox domain-containing protein n=1 Tax=Linum tenue TaxID=586396 RepID=A0AAV0HAW5_9ROSI|nr:unnamed protein product [Linum tenue]